MLNFLCTDNYLCFDKMKDITTMDSTFATKKKALFPKKKQNKEICCCFKSVSKKLYKEKSYSLH